MARIQYADDDTSSVKRLVRIRLPSILLGLCLGILLSFVTSRFEEVLAKDIRIAFFIPFIVYMAAAVGNQTQSIFSRDLKSRKTSFHKYLVKETSVGFLLGLLSAIGAAAITWFWFGSIQITLIVSSAMFLAVGISPVVALIVTEATQLEHIDPAAGSGPISTIIQDMLSVLIYGVIATTVLL
jgi:magnesium transporter